jgi:peptidoglycan/xylan/chitin deacetylase (PgdA/CDA1 family)
MQWESARNFERQSLVPLTVQPPALVHVDLDGAFEICAAHGRRWNHAGDPLFESGLANALEFFDQNHIRATLFTVARQVDRNGALDLIREAVRLGHEIASHTMTHANLSHATVLEKRRELIDSRLMLEDRLGVPVVGFRAPGYSIDRQCLEILAESGYEYDSSAFPTPDFAAKLDVPIEALMQPTALLPDSPLLEIPLPAYRPLPFPFNPSYTLLLGTHYFRWGVERMRRRNAPLVLLFHLVDFAAPLRSRQLWGLKSRIFTLSIMSVATKVARCQTMLDMVRQDYCLTPTGSFLDSWRTPVAAQLVSSSHE